MNMALRIFLWLLAVALVTFVTAIGNILIDKLPIWFSREPHFLIESAVFWFVVAPRIWHWLARRVWVVPASEIPSTESRGAAK